MRGREEIIDEQLKAFSFNTELYSIEFLEAFRRFLLKKIPTHISKKQQLTNLLQKILTKLRASLEVYKKLNKTINWDPALEIFIEPQVGHDLQSSEIDSPHDLQQNLSVLITTVLNCLCENNLHQFFWLLEKIFSKYKETVFTEVEIQENLVDLLKNNPNLSLENIKKLKLFINIYEAEFLPYGILTKDQLRLFREATLQAVVLNKAGKDFIDLDKTNKTVSEKELTRGVKKIDGKLKLTTQRYYQLKQKIAEQQKKIDIIGRLLIQDISEFINSNDIQSLVERMQLNVKLREFLKGKKFFYLYGTTFDAVMQYITANIPPVLENFYETEWNYLYKAIARAIIKSKLPAPRSQITNTQQVNTVEFSFGEIIGRGGEHTVIQANLKSNKTEYNPPLAVRIGKNNSDKDVAVQDKLDSIYQLNIPNVIKPIYTTDYKEMKGITQSFEVFHRAMLGNLGSFPLTFLQIQQAFIKIFDTVKYLHSSGYAHLDIKPQNILCMDYHDVLLCDVESIVSLSANIKNIPQGTEEFRPKPAQHVTIDGEYLKSLDIYALGVSLYLVLAGRMPPLNEHGGFKGFIDAETNGKFFAEIMGESSLKLKDKISKSEAALAAEVIEKLLVLNPKERVDNFNEIMQYDFFKIPEQNKVTNKFLAEIKSEEPTGDVKAEDFYQNKIQELQTTVVCVESAFREEAKTLVVNFNEIKTNLIDDQPTNKKYYTVNEIIEKQLAIEEQHRQQAIMLIAKEALEIRKKSYYKKHIEVSLSKVKVSVEYDGENTIDDMLMPTLTDGHYVSEAWQEFIVNYRNFEDRKIDIVELIRLLQCQIDKFLVIKDKNELVKLNIAFDLIKLALTMPKLSSNKKLIELENSYREKIKQIYNTNPLAEIDIIQVDFTADELADESLNKKIKTINLPKIKSKVFFEKVPSFRQWLVATERYGRFAWTSGEKFIDPFTAIDSAIKKYSRAVTDDDKIVELLFLMQACKEWLCEADNLDKRFEVYQLKMAALQQINLLLEKYFNGEQLEEKSINKIKASTSIMPKLSLFTENLFAKAKSIAISFDNKTIISSPRIKLEK